MEDGYDAARKRVIELLTEKVAVKAVVDAQAEDDGLWFEAQTAPEAYLQAALRRLHAAIETPNVEVTGTAAALSPQGPSGPQG
jgi:hypothetical protein